MIDPFLLKIILSFIVGAVWLTGATVIAEKFGSKIGGVIAGLPSTTLLALFFIAWTQSPYVAAESTGVIPAIMGLDAMFTALSGTIIALSVIMTKLGGPIMGGVFASFPAIMLSSIIITYLAYGRDFSVAVMKVIMVNGSLNVVIYTSMVRYFYIIFDLVTGTVLAFLISLMTSYLTYQFIKRKMS